MLTKKQAYEYLKQHIKDGREDEFQHVYEFLKGRYVSPKTGKPWSLSTIGNYYYKGLPGRPEEAPKTSGAARRQLRLIELALKDEAMSDEDKLESIREIVHVGGEAR